MREVTRIKRQRFLYSCPISRSRKIYWEISHTSNYINDEFIKHRSHRTWMGSIRFSTQICHILATWAWILSLSFSSIFESLILSTLRTHWDDLIRWWIWQCSKSWEKLRKYKILYIIIFIGCLLRSSPGKQQCSKRLRSQLCISMKNSISRTASPF